MKVEGRTYVAVEMNSEGSRRVLSPTIYDHVEWRNLGYKTKIKCDVARMVFREIMLLLILVLAVPGHTTSTCMVVLQTFHASLNFHRFIPSLKSLE